MRRDRDTSTSIDVAGPGAPERARLLSHHSAVAERLRGSPNDRMRLVLCG